MRIFLTLLRRELMAYFVTPAAYVVMIIVLVVVGVGFWGQAVLSLGEPVRLDVILFWPPTLWAMVLITATVVTMRLFAWEKRSGTIEPLMTAPVTEVEVVLAKYVAAVVLFVVIFAPTAAYPFILRKFSSGVQVIDTGALAAGYLILALTGAFYVSVGVLMSALSGSQIGAAITCFAALCGAFSIGVIGHIFRGGGNIVILEYVSAFEHVADFSRGVIDTRPIVLYVSGIALMLFVTVKVVESRRWI